MHDVVRRLMSWGRAATAWTLTTWAPWSGLLRLRGDVHPPRAVRRMLLGH